MAGCEVIEIDELIKQAAQCTLQEQILCLENIIIQIADTQFVRKRISSNDFGQVIGFLLSCMNNSTVVSNLAIQILTEIICRSNKKIKIYCTLIIWTLMSRLDDPNCNESIRSLYSSLIESSAIDPQTFIDNMASLRKHKNEHYRYEFFNVINDVLKQQDTTDIRMADLISWTLISLGDKSTLVRSAAITTLEELYKHTGESLRVKINAAGFDQAVLVHLNDCLDGVSDENIKMLSDIETETLCDMETFEASFEVVPQLTIFSPTDMEENLKNMNVIIGNKNMDWEKRVDALRKIRSLLMMDQALFIPYFKDLSIAFLDILKELRSQVIREACITIAYMSKMLKSKLDSFCVYILQELINLVPNSVKVIASAGTIALKFVIKYTHAPELIPIITQNLIQSKSKDIRSNLSELLGLLFDDWSPRLMEKYLPNLRESLIKGIADADSDVREYSRRNFWSFKRHFPDIGDQIYLNLDPSVQRALDRERETATKGTGGSMSASPTLKYVPDKSPPITEGLESGPFRLFENPTLVETPKKKKKSVKVKRSNEEMYVDVE